MTSKRDVLETERMLERLCVLLYEHRVHGAKVQSTSDGLALRRISMTLHRWHELECGTGDGHIERDEKSGKPWYVSDRYHGGGFDRTVRSGIPDREAGALKRLKAIMARYPALRAYVQTDSRGCALYILKPGDVPKGEDVSAYYSGGLAVHR